MEECDYRASTKIDRKLRSGCVGWSVVELGATCKDQCFQVLDVCFRFLKLFCQVCHLFIASLCCKFSKTKLICPRLQLILLSEYGDLVAISLARLRICFKSQPGVVALFIQFNLYVLSLYLTWICVSELICNFNLRVKLQFSILHSNLVLICSNDHLISFHKFFYLLF